MVGRWLAVLAVLLTAALALPLGAEEGEGTPAGPGPGAEQIGGVGMRRTQPVLTRAAVRDHVLVFPVRRANDLSQAMLPGGRVGTRQWSGMPEGSAVYDPTNGYYYSPATRTDSVPVTVTLGDGSVYVVYVPFDASQPMTADQYRRLVAMAGAYARAIAAQPEAAQGAGEGGERVEAAPQPGAVASTRRAPTAAAPAGHFGSRLALMLGGHSPVSMEFALGEAKLRQGRFGEAISALHQSAIAQPNDPASHLALALAFAGAGSYDAAAQELKRGLGMAAKPGTLAVGPETGLGRSAAFATVRANVSQAVAEAPDNPDRNALAGFIAFLAGDYQRASQLLERSRDLGPRDAGVARLLVAARARLRGAGQEATAAPAGQDGG